MKTIEEFDTYVLELRKTNIESFSKNNSIIVGYGTCGIAAGAKGVIEEIEKILKELGRTDIILEKTGCIGCCSYEPMIDIKLAESPQIAYKNVTKENVSDIIKNHLESSYLIEHILGIVSPPANLFFPEDQKPLDLTSELKEIPLFYQLPRLEKQKRIVLRNIGRVNPESLDNSLINGGYQSLRKVLSTITSIELIQEIKNSKLRGRGGAGFPTGLKWEFAYNAPSKTKYVICNADEGDPGAFMDRALIEGDPHSVIEGLMLAGYATGASKGYFYIRAEYPLAIKRLEIALDQLRKINLLGENILGSSFSFELEIRKGAGAFVCGEETALINSIMGLRGEPRPRPPYPATKGLWDCPTTINNVKTLATVPVIISQGSEWFKSIGTEDTPGTAIFALAGDVKHSGLVEVPMGTTLREIIFDIGGGVKNDKQFKAVQTGGPSGGCIPESLLDVQVDFKNLAAIGSIMGSGGMIVCSTNTCMVDLAKYFLAFTQDESCGKCTPCREGTLRALEILERITTGKADMEDLKDLDELCNVIKQTSLCGLGQTAPNPILSTLNYFKDEYENHIQLLKCDAHVCKELYRVMIDETNCIKCGKCFRECPVNAVSGSKQTGYLIDCRVCTRCNHCLAICPVETIVKVSGSCPK